MFNERHFVVGTCLFSSRWWLITKFEFSDLSQVLERKTRPGWISGTRGDNKIKWGGGRKIWGTRKMKVGSNNRRWKWRLYTLNQTRGKKEIETGKVISPIFLHMGDKSVVFSLPPLLQSSPAALINNATTTLAHLSYSLFHLTYSFFLAQPTSQSLMPLSISLKSLPICSTSRP